MTREGGHVLVDQLALHGVERCYGVPGESFLSVLDGIAEHAGRLRFIGARHEAGAANMAAAEGELTGRPGVCLVTRGPGAAQGAVGVHTAMQDSTPLLYLVGDVARGQRGREAFQEVDLPAFLGPLAKWAATIDDAARIPELVSRAFHVATSGRPGPVVLALPEDMLVDRVDVADAVPYRPVQAAPEDALVDRLHALLAGAERPLIVLGGSVWSQAAADALAAFAEASELPVACEFRRQDHLDNLSPAYVGDVGLGVNPALVERIRSADVLVLLGGRFGEVPSGGYAHVPVPRRGTGTLVHVHGDPDELNRVYAAELPVLGSAPAVVAALAARGPAGGGARRAAWRAAARADYEAWSEPAPRGLDGVDLGVVVRALRELLPPEAVLANGAGNFTVWLHRYYRHRRVGTQLAPTSGAMGYGVPAAVAAKAVAPQRPVVCLAGDGDVQMSALELATAVQEELPIVVVVADNGMYGTIRMHQERRYPGRVSGTALRNPDLAALARACGAHGLTVTRDAEVPDALAEALAAGRPSLVHCLVDPRAITPGALLEA